jgi:hypothetical protein
MITQHTKIYNGKGYTFTTGIDETGKAPIQIVPDHAHERTGQTYKRVFSSLYIKGDTSNDGNPIYAVTVWEEQHFDNKGNKIASYTKEESHRTSAAEFPLFVQSLLPMLEGSIYNGAVAGGSNADSIFLGHPNNRPFLPDGTFDPIEVTTAPTYDYHPPSEDPLNP